MNGQGRSTATVQRVDLSSTHHGASAVPATNREAVLFHAYRHILETVDCACGGTVTADPEAPAKGVQAHNYTGRHKAWRSNREID
jgi:hypothetical protein